MNISNGLEWRNVLWEIFRSGLADRRGRGSGDKPQKVCRECLTVAERQPSASLASQTACLLPKAEFHLPKTQCSLRPYQRWRRMRSHSGYLKWSSDLLRVVARRGHKGCRGSRWSEEGTAEPSTPGQGCPRTRRLEKRERNVL